MGIVEIAEKWIEGMNRHNVDEMFSLCTEDLIGLEVAEGKPNHGLNAVRESYVDLFRGFPNCRCETMNVFSGDDQVLIEVQWSGTNTGSFRGESPTNKFVDVRIAYIFKFRGNKISQITEYYDGAAVAAQMGN